MMGRVAYLIPRASAGTALSQCEWATFTCDLISCVLNCWYSRLDRTRVPSLRYLSRIAETTEALTSRKRVWDDRSTFLNSKIRQMRPLVTSIFLYACESWTLTEELQRWIRAMEMRCYRQNTTHIIGRPCYQRGRVWKALAGNRTTWRLPDHGKETPIYRFIRSGQNHFVRHSETGKKTRQTKKGWENNIREWTDLEVTKPQRAVGEQGKMEETGCEVTYGAPTTPAVTG